MSARVRSIDRITIAVGIGLLVQVGVTGDEPSHLRVVEPASHQRQPHVPFCPVAARRPELVRARAAAGAGDHLPECRQRQAGRHCLAAVGDSPLGTQPVEQWILPVPIGRLLCTAWPRCYISVPREQGPFTPKPREEDAPQP